MKKIASVILVWLFFIHSVSTLQAQEVSPVDQCIRGNELYQEDNFEAALPLLKAGFEAREQAEFNNLNDLGYCAFALGAISYTSGDLQTALVAYSVASEIFAQTDEKLLEGQSLLQEGIILQGLGYGNQVASIFYNDALILFQAIDNPNLEGATLLLLGSSFEAQVQYGQAMEYYQEALAIFHNSNDGYNEGTVLTLIARLQLKQNNINDALISYGNSGLAYYLHGDYDQALIIFEEGLALSQAINDPVTKVGWLILIGNTYAIRGQFQQALSTYEEALHLIPNDETSDVKIIKALNLSGIAQVYVNLGQYPLALSNYEVALSIMRDQGHLTGEAQVLAGIGKLYINQGNYQQALVSLQSALQLINDTDNLISAADSSIGDAVNLIGESDILNSIGIIYLNRGNFPEALIHFENALDISRQVNNRLGESQTLNNIASVYNSLSQYDEALRIYSESLEINRSLNFPSGVSSSLNNIGIVYLSLDQYDEALESLQEALEIKRAIGDLQGEGHVLSNIAIGQDKQGRYSIALVTFQDALNIQMNVGDVNGQGTTLNGIGNIYHAQGLIDKALESYNQALNIRQEIGDRRGFSETLNNIASLFESQFQYGRALTTYQQSLTIIREIGNRFGEAAILDNIAGIYYVQGQLDLALNTYEEALAIRQEIGTAVGEATTLGNIALIYSEKGEYNSAIVAHERALSIWQDIDNLEGQAVNLNGLATVYADQNQYDLAIATIEEALLIRREVGDRRGEGISLNRLGTIYAKAGQFDVALQYLEEALAIRREINDHRGEGLTLINIADVYSELGQHEPALTAYHAAIVIFEDLRVTAGNDLERGSFINQFIPLYHRALTTALEAENFSDAFLIGELGRSRSFHDSLATGYVQFSYEEDNALFEVERVSFNEMLAIEDALTRALALNPFDAEVVADLQTQLDLAKVTYDEALEAIEAKSEQLATLASGRRNVATLSETQEMLDDQSTLVSFWVLQDKTVAFILTGSSFNVITLNITEEALNTQIKAFHDFAEINSTQPETAVSLYETLITPIHSYLNTPHLIIVPHQVLNYVPFAALTDGERYLMDDFAITYLPNAGMLRFLPDSSETPKYATALILANPTANTADEFGNPLSNLPNAKQSAQTIAGLLGATALTDEAATEAAVRQDVSNANILHIGAHGRFNTVAPMQSTLYLTPGNIEMGVEDDGRLHVDEIYGLPLNNLELVVLSACETNLGFLDRDNPLNNISAGDEIVSLNRAFLFQSPTVISTLWTVDDAATSLLMERFYIYLLDGKSKADSLRLAQLDVREEYPNPYYWAGFVLSGDGGNIDAALLSENVTNTQLQPETIAENTLTDSSSNIETTTQGELETKIAPIVWLLPVVLVIVVGGFVFHRRRNGV